MSWGMPIESLPESDHRKMFKFAKKKSLQGVPYLVIGRSVLMSKIMLGRCLRYNCHALVLSELQPKNRRL